VAWQRISWSKTPVESSALAWVMERLKLRA
jgi:hypothetical protein